MPSKKIAPVADNLIDTLRAKAEALDELKTLFEQQLEALRAGDVEALEELTTNAQECAAVLENRRQKSARQARLLGRVLDESDKASLQELIEALEARSDRAVAERLAEAHAAVEERAQDVHDCSETLRFALQYAADVNHELLAAMRGAVEEEEAHTYTATGQAESQQPSDDRSFVNTLG